MNNKTDQIVLPVAIKKYAHRYEYLRTYAKNKYHTDEAYRLRVIEKVKSRKLRNKKCSELALKEISLLSV